MKTTVRNFLLAAVIAAFGAGMAGSAAADSANDIKYRKAHMKAMAGHIGAIFMVLKGEAGDKSHIAGHAAALAAIGAMTPSLFPAGSGTGDTAALAGIWEKPAEFKKVVQALGAATAALKVAAATGDMSKIGHAAGDVGKACGSCHKVNRKKR